MNGTASLTASISERHRLAKRTQALSNSMKSRQRLTLMILEDNRADVFLLKEALKEAEMNFTSLVFEDGESAFRYIDTLGADTKVVPDAAILDLNVPNRDGSEVLTHIRQNPRLSSLRQPERLMGFIRTIAQRQVAAQIKCFAKSRQREGEIQAGLEFEVREPNPEKLAMINESAGIVRQALAQLRGPEREILVRFYLREQSVEQICSEMNR